MTVQGLRKSEPIAFTSSTVLFRATSCLSSFIPHPIVNGSKNAEACSNDGAEDGPVLGLLRLGLLLLVESLTALDSADISRSFSEEKGLGVALLLLQDVVLLVKDKISVLLDAFSQAPGVP